MPLSELAVRTAKPKDKQYKLFDMNGLFLIVAPSGGKLWRFKYRFARKELQLSFGKYPIVDLKTAREKCFEAHKHVANGMDPRTLI